jgi:hypothetical protein
MTAKGWFILILRGFGVWQFTFAVEYFASALCVHAGFYRTNTGSFEFYLVAALVHLVSSLVLLVFAPAIARIFYPAAPSPDE